jgi:hypothetical protein
LDIIAQKRVELETLMGDKSLRIATKISTLKEKLYKDENKRIEDEKDLLASRLEDLHKTQQDFIDKELIRMDKEAEDKWNKEVEWQRKLFEYNRKSGQEEWDAKIAQEKALANAVIEIHESLADSKIRIATSVTNILNSIAGENKTLQMASILADKALAIAEVIIQTTKANATLRAMAAASVLPGPGYLVRLSASMAAIMAPINYNRAAAAVDIASIVAAAAMQMKSMQSNSSSSFASPNAISSSPTAQRSFSTPVGSTILTQPVFTQSQLNAFPNQNMLTANDIARAMAAMPAPVVTVEDINAKVRAKQKVDVRGNI